MKKTMLHSFLTLSLACGLVHGLPQSVAARSVLDVPDLTDIAGKPLFRFDIFDKGEKRSDGEQSAYTLSKEEKQAMRTGTLYWSSLLLPHAANTGHLRIEVTTKNDRTDNATGGSETSEDGTTELVAAINGRSYAANKALGQITIERAKNEKGWYVGPMASLPQNGVLSDLNSTMLHEMGHALGMNSSASKLLKPEPSEQGIFGERLSRWDTHLRDIHGNAPKAGQIITTDPAVSDGFIVRPKDPDSDYSGVYFAGPTVMGVLTVDGKVAQLAWPDGSALAKVPGLPVLDSTNGVIDFSHIELQNGLMSHQEYRNWTTFMEAELAAMQDVGLKFDRRNMYGFSVYNDGLTYVNTNPYYARTADGQWIVGKPNATAYGTGFHIYGSKNTLRQAADLLSSGTYGIGIRMDGSSNTLTIDPNVRVQASGFGGIGLAVAYGKDHRIIQRGALTALGTGGIGARFDFGDNSMGNDTEYRGS